MRAPKKSVKQRELEAQGIETGLTAEEITEINKKYGFREFKKGSYGFIKSQLSMIKKANISEEKRRILRNRLTSLGLNLVTLRKEIREAEENSI